MTNARHLAETRPRSERSHSLRKLRAQVASAIQLSFLLSMGAITAAVATSAPAHGPQVSRASRHASPPQVQRNETGTSGAALAARQFDVRIDGRCGASIRGGTNGQQAVVLGTAQADEMRLVEDERGVIVVTPVGACLVPGSDEDLTVLLGAGADTIAIEASVQRRTSVYGGAGADEFVSMTQGPVIYVAGDPERVIPLPPPSLSASQRRGPRYAVPRG